MALINMKKDWARVRVRGKGEEWKAGGGVWREACHDVVVLRSKDLLMKLWQKETSEQARILSPRVKLWEALDLCLRGFFLM